MTKMLTAATATLALLGMMTVTAEAASHAQPSLMQKVSSTGWASRTNEDRYSEVFGEVDGYAAPSYGYGRAIHRRAHRVIPPSAAYNSGVGGY